MCNIFHGKLISQLIDVWFRWRTCPRRGLCLTSPIWQPLVAHKSLLLFPLRNRTSPLAWPTSCVLGRPPSTESPPSALRSVSTNLITQFHWLSSSPSFYKLMGELVRFDNVISIPISFVVIVCNFRELGSINREICCCLVRGGRTT